MLKDALLRGRSEALLLFRVKDASLGEAALHMGKSVGLGALSTGIPTGLAMGVMGRAKDWKERAQNAGKGFLIGAIPGSIMGTAVSIEDAVRMMRPPTALPPGVTPAMVARASRAEARTARNEVRRQNDPNPLPTPQLDVARGQVRESVPQAGAQPPLMPTESTDDNRFSFLEVDPPTRK